MQNMLNRSAKIINDQDPGSDSDGDGTGSVRSQLCCKMTFGNFIKNKKRSRRSAATMSFDRQKRNNNILQKSQNEIRQDKKQKALDKGKSIDGKGMV